MLGFVFILIVRGTHCKLGLKTNYLSVRRKAFDFNQPDYTPVAERSLQLENGIQSPLK
jgi:hypothetical protein